MTPLAHMSLSDGHLVPLLVYVGQVALCVAFTAWCARVWWSNRRGRVAPRGRHEPTSSGSHQAAAE